MTFDNINIGMRVKDRWFDNWGTGQVIQKSKTQLKIRFVQKDVVYEREHCQFLEVVDE